MKPAHVLNGLQMLSRYTIWNKKHLSVAIPSCIITLVSLKVLKKKKHCKPYLFCNLIL